MKFLQTLAFVAAVIAAISSAPVPRANWTVVEAKTAELERLVRVSLESIRSTANSDNAQVGATISEKLDNAGALALVQLEAAQTAIADRTLTRASAEVILQGLEQVLLRLQQDVTVDVNKLSPNAQANIRATFEAAYVNARAIAEEIYAALDAPGLLANWTVVEAKTAELERLVRVSLESIRSTANSDNAQVGATISEKLDNAGALALVQLEAAQQAIADRTLTRASAEVILQALEQVLLRLQQDVTVDVNKLSPNAQANIRATFEAAYVNARAIAEEIYAALDAPGLLANWTVVEAEVGNLETLVRISLDSVRTTANSDNPQVGATISEKIEVASVGALNRLEQAKAAIADRTLTRTEAQRILQELEGILLKLQEDVAGDVAQLSPAAQASIKNIFETAYTNAGVIAQNIYAALD